MKSIRISHDLADSNDLFAQNSRASVLHRILRILRQVTEAQGWQGTCQYVVVRIWFEFVLPWFGCWSIGSLYGSMRGGAFERWGVVGGP
jgi:hypothetical protein